MKKNRSRSRTRNIQKQTESIADLKNSAKKNKIAPVLETKSQKRTLKELDNYNSQSEKTNSEESKTNSDNVKDVKNRRILTAKRKETKKPDKQTQPKSKKVHTKNKPEI